MAQQKTLLRAVDHALNTYRKGTFYKEWVRERARLKLEEEPDRLTVRRCGKCNGKRQGRKHENPRHLVVACPFCGKWYYEGVDITTKPAIVVRGSI